MSGALDLGEYALGLVLAGVTLGCAIAVGKIVVRRRFAHLQGPPRLAAVVLLTILVVLAAHVLPLIAAILTRFTAPACAVVLLLLATRLRAEAPRTVEADPVASPAHRASWILGVAGLLIALTGALAYLAARATFHPASTDFLGVHLPSAVRFLQTHSMWESAQYLPSQAHTNYPQYGDVLLLYAMLPWRATSFVRFVDPVLLAVAAGAIYAAGREIGASAPAALLAGLCAVVVRPAASTAFADTLTDPAFLAGFSIAVLFLLRHWRTGHRGELVLAGVGLGIAVGTKWYGLTTVPALLVAWGAIAALDATRRRMLPRALAILIGVTAVTGGIWMLRNLILTGDPVFPARVSLFGVTIFDAPFDALRARVGHSIAEYATDLDVLRTYIFPVLGREFSLAGGLIAAAPLAALAYVLPRRRAVDPRIAMLAIAAILLAVAYTLTPYSAFGFEGKPVLANVNMRYAVPVLVAAAPLLAWLCTRLGRVGLLLETAMVVAVALGVHRSIPAEPRYVVAAGAVVVAGAGCAWAWRRRGALAPRLAGGLALLAVLGAAAAGYRVERRLAARPYEPSDPTVTFVQAFAPAGTRIGVAGLYIAHGLGPVGPLFGPRFDNHVSYVGPTRDHLLQQYRSGAEFAAALERGKFALLEIGTGFPPRPHPREETWARSAGYVPVARSDRLVLMALRPSR